MRLLVLLLSVFWCCFAQDSPRQKSPFEKLKEVWAKVDAARARGEGPKMVSQSIPPEKVRERQRKMAQGESDKAEDKRKKSTFEKMNEVWAKVDAARARGEGPKMVTQTLPPHVLKRMEKLSQLSAVLEGTKQQAPRNLEDRPNVVISDSGFRLHLDEEIEARQFLNISWAELQALRKDPTKMERMISKAQYDWARFDADRMFFIRERARLYVARDFTFNAQIGYGYKQGVLRDELEKEKRKLKEDSLSGPKMILRMRSGVIFKNVRCTIAECNDESLLRRMERSGIDWDAEIDYQLDYLSPVDGESTFRKQVALLARETGKCFPVLAKFKSLPNSVCGYDKIEALSKMEDAAVKTPVGLRAAAALLKLMKNDVLVFLKTIPSGFLYLTRLVYYHAVARASRHLRKLRPYCPDRSCRDAFQTRLDRFASIPWHEWITPYFYGTPSAFHTGYLYFEQCIKEGGENLCGAEMARLWLQKVDKTTEHDVKAQIQFSWATMKSGRRVLARAKDFVNRVSLTPLVKSEIVGELKAVADLMLLQSFMYSTDEDAIEASQEASDCWVSCGVKWLFQGWMKESRAMARLHKFAYLRYMKWLCVSSSCELLVEAEKTRILQEGFDVYGVAGHDYRDKLPDGPMKNGVFATPVAKLPYVFGLILNSAVLLTISFVCLWHVKLWRDMRLVLGLASMVVVVSVSQLVLWTIARKSLRQMISALSLASLEPWVKLNAALAWTDLVANAALLIVAGALFYQWAAVVMALKGKEHWEKRLGFVVGAMLVVIIITASGLLIRLSTRYNGSLAESKHTVSLMMVNAITLTSLTTLGLVLAISLQTFMALHLWRSEGKKAEAWFVVKEILLLFFVVVGLGIRIAFQATYAYQNDTIMFYLNYLLAQGLIVLPIVLLVWLAFAASRRRLKGAPLMEMHSSLLGQDELDREVPAAYKDF